MRIHFLRNATLIMEIGYHSILVDPMLGSKGSLPPFAFVRHHPRRNPTVSLPPGAESLLNTVTTGLITHCRRGHFDHLDLPGSQFLAKREIPVFCNHLDKNYLKKRGITTIALHPNQSHDFLDGIITPFETAHGYGFVSKLMGPGLGYFLELPNEPRLYISGDTVLTSIVKHVLTNLRPDISILAAGGASLDIGKPILMPMAELLAFIQMSPGIVIATHIEALNHCPITRNQLLEHATQAGLINKLRVPKDGETLVI